MDRLEIDERIRRHYRANAVPFSAAGFEEELAERIVARNAGRKSRARYTRRSTGQRANRSPRRARRPLLAFGLAALVVAGITAGAILGAGWRPGNPVMVFTDSTAGETTVAGAATATTAAGSAITLAPTATIPKAELERMQRVAYDRAHQHVQQDLATADFLWPPSLQQYAADSELVVTGQVVKVDPARWNTPDGRKPATMDVQYGPDGREYMPTEYDVFYVEPKETLKGSPRFGSPVAIISYNFVSRDAALMEVGDQVLVMAQYDKRHSGTWDDDAYFLSEGELGVYMLVGGRYLNVFDERVTATTKAIKDFVWAEQINGPYGIDADLVSTAKTLNDVTAAIPKGARLKEPVGDVPAGLRAQFEAANPGARLLYVGSGNRDGEMNAVLSSKNLHGMWFYQEEQIYFDFFGATSTHFGPTKYPEGVVGEFLDILKIPDTLDFYMRLRDPITGNEFFARIPLSGDEREGLEYNPARLVVFDLAAEAQLGGDGDPDMRELLRYHRLSAFLQRGDIVRVRFSAINWASTGKWKVFVDGRGIQVANQLIVERFSGADSLFSLLQSVVMQRETDAGL